MIHELKIIDGKLYLDEKRLFGVNGYTINVCETSDRCGFSELTLNIAVKLAGINSKQLNGGETQA